MLQAAVQGEGIALGSLMLAADLIRDESLATPIPIGIKAASAYYLAYKEAGIDRPQLPLFLNWLFQAVSEFNENEINSFESKFSVLGE
jgi:LysR family glycine cleavage system transcriptional activator